MTQTAAIIMILTETAIVWMKAETVYIIELSGENRRVAANFSAALTTKKRKKYGYVRQTHTFQRRPAGVGPN